nr:DUF488 domain-containing protein [Mycoavidus sp. B2-EB]
MQSSEFADNVQWVANLARTERCVLMCAEALLQKPEIPPKIVDIIQTIFKPRL